jgi:hypothetical protein
MILFNIFCIFAAKMISRLSKNDEEDYQKTVDLGIGGILLFYLSRDKCRIYNGQRSIFVGYFDWVSTLLTPQNVPVKRL